MPPKSARPLRRTNINLYEDDCIYMERRYGHGWSEKVRELLHQRIQKLRADDEEWRTRDPL